MAVGKNITWTKGKGKQYHLSITLRLSGRIFWVKNQDLKNGGGEEYQAVRNFIHPFNLKVDQGSI